MDRGLNLLDLVDETLPSLPGAAALFDLIRPKDERARWQSTLNNDGSPFQIAIADTRGGKGGIRLIADPFRPGRDERDRCGANLAAFDRLQDRCSANAAARCRDFMAALAPSFQGRCERRGGDVWLAAELSGPGVGIYVTAKGQGAADRGERLIAAAGIEHHGPQVAAIHEHCAVQAYSIQGSRTRNLAINIYWKPRPGATAIPRGIGYDAGTIGQMPLAGPLAHRPAIALTFCSTFSVVGEARGSKLDLCNHCLEFDAQECLSTLARFSPLSPRFSQDVAQIARSKEAEVAFIGARMKPEGNTGYVYFKPRRDPR